MKDRENINLIYELVNKKPVPKKENWFKDLKNYQADDRILKDKKPIVKK